MLPSFVRPTPMTDRLYEYVLSVGLREPDTFRALREETATLPECEWQIAPEQGPFLALIVQLMGAKKCLEVGTFTGYSAAWVASVLPADGKLVCCELSAVYAGIAQKHLTAAGLANKVEFRIAPAVQSLTDLLANGHAGTFDYAFIDADKSSYNIYYERCLELVRPGGLIAIDNTLWDGKPADSSVTDMDTLAIRALNEKVHGDARVSLSFLPFADGLTLARKNT
ncbi:class I SAM-dependent methyltransferase [Gemmata sp. G18]|uniref:Class I SAM-dependent methyltransferase n=1 Tax=Gemmata palustris TaxID=2822762 RepID=A0ABS5BUY5_9BACT|nr:class I SAM-dependent methyltransferase [Gemmata palustris]MBP3957535.1 class I SAM-dependent methyltransferase [Gemmata palustris]